MTTSIQSLNSEGSYLRAEIDRQTHLSRENRRYENASLASAARYKVKAANADTPMAWGAAVGEQEKQQTKAADYKRAADKCDAEIAALQAKLKRLEKRLAQLRNQTPQQELTIDDVRACARDHIATLTNGRAKVIEILNEYGVRLLSELDPQHYQAVIEKIGGY